MSASGDIAVLQFGDDSKWHWKFFSPSALSTLSFNTGGVVTLGPLSMSAMSNPVKATIDALTSQGGPTWIAALATQDYANAAQAYAIQRSHHTGTQTASTISDFNSAVSTILAPLTAGAPSQLDTFLEAYNRFLTDESAATALNSAVAAGDATNASAITSEVSTRAAADATLTSAVAGKQASANLATATLDFGFASGQEGDVATTTVSASWVTANSRIVCLPSPAASADHSTDETLAEDIRFTAVNIVPGASFDVVSFAPNGTWGRHNCSVIAP